MFQGVVQRRVSKSSSIGDVIYRAEDLSGERVRRATVEVRREIGRASCRERVC